ncbi:hypothetical protein Poly51_11680 [Rubripirellula tenax]|uniref:Transmembrane protein n=1 Tax=Rubripirellula tenax TaxID=2528015 RepID=A0A5C6FGM7_9BACT|nr:hypothetical protein Poly51_11680 [Rubripirellula tenax]
MTCTRGRESRFFVCLRVFRPSRVMSDVLCTIHSPFHHPMMRDTNPYSSPNSPGQPSCAVVAPRQTLRWAMIGFILAAAVPVIFGIRGTVYQWTYLANVTLGPNEAHCGNPIPFILIFFVGPICGIMGAAGGAFCASVFDCALPRYTAPLSKAGTEQ